MGLHVCPLFPRVQTCRLPRPDLTLPPSTCSATVYRALYLNEIVAAKEIDIGRSHAMQEAFVNVSQAGPGWQNRASNDAAWHCVLAFHSG